MSMIIVKRNGQQVHYQSEEFLSLCAARQFLRTDEIFDWNSVRFLRADHFSDMSQYLPPKSISEIVEEIIGGVVAVGTVLVLSVGAASLLESLFGATTPVTRKPGFPNHEPL